MHTLSLLLRDHCAIPNVVFVFPLAQFRLQFVLWRAVSSSLFVFRPWAMVTKYRPHRNVVLPRVFTPTCAKSCASPLVHTYRRENVKIETLQCHSVDSKLFTKSYMSNNIAFLHHLQFYVTLGQASSRCKQTYLDFCIGASGSTRLSKLE